MRTCSALNLINLFMALRGLHQLMSTIHTTAEAGKVIKYAPMFPRLRRASAYAPRQMRAAGAEKMEYFITFPASALVWKALLGAPSVHLRSDFSPQGAFPWPPARGVPPFWTDFRHKWPTKFP